MRAKLGVAAVAAVGVTATASYQYHQQQSFANSLSLTHLSAHADSASQTTPPHSTQAQQPPLQGDGVQYSESLQPIWRERIPADVRRGDEDGYGGAVPEGYREWWLGRVHSALVVPKEWQGYTYAAETHDDREQVAPSGLSPAEQAAWHEAQLHQQHHQDRQEGGCVAYLFTPEDLLRSVREAREAGVPVPDPSVMVSVKSCGPISMTPFMPVQLQQHMVSSMLQQAVRVFWQRDNYKKVPPEVMNAPPGAGGGRARRQKRTLSDDPAEDSAAQYLVYKDGTTVAERHKQQQQQQQQQQQRSGKDKDSKDNLLAMPRVSLELLSREEMDPFAPPPPPRQGQPPPEERLRHMVADVIVVPREDRVWQFTYEAHADKWAEREPQLMEMRRNVKLYHDRK